MLYSADLCWPLLISALLCSALLYLCFCLCPLPLPVCLYACIPVYLYTCIPVYLYTCIPVCLYTCIPVYLYTRIPVYMYTSPLLSSPLLYPTLPCPTLPLPLHLHLHLHLHLPRLYLFSTSSLPLLYSTSALPLRRCQPDTLIFGPVRMWLHDLLRHMPTGHNDPWANVTSWSLKSHANRTQWSLG